MPKSLVIKLIFLCCSLSNILSVPIISLVTPLQFLKNTNRDKFDLSKSSENIVVEGNSCIRDDEDEISETKAYLEKSVIYDRNWVLLNLSGGARSKNNDEEENEDDEDNDDDDEEEEDADGGKDETVDDDDDDDEESQTTSGDDNNNDVKDSSMEDTESVNSSEKNDEDDDEDYNDNDDDDEEPVPKKKSSKFSKKQSKKRRPSMLETGVGSLASAATAAFKLTKGGVKTAVDLVSSKHVTMTQIAGKWRMEQEVELRKGATVTCPATIEFTEQGQVITAFEGKLFTSEYKFTERPWPRKCTIQFEATAFQGPNDKEPVSMFYKGHFKRSMMNPNVILIRGRVYKLLGKLFWKQQKKCGKFKATQRRYR